MDEMKYSVIVNICMFTVTECVSGFTNGQMVQKITLFYLQCGITVKLINYK